MTMYPVVSSVLSSPPWKWDLPRIFRAVGLGLLG